MADRYWVIGIDGDPTSWNNASNWSATEGGAGGAGVPTAADDVFFSDVNVTNCTIDVAAAAKSITNTTTLGLYTGTLDAATYAVTVAENFSFKGGNLDLGSGTWTVAGNWDTVGVDFTYSTGSTVVMSGASKTLATLVDDRFYDLTFSGSTTSNSKYSVANNLVVSGTVTISNGLYISISASSDFTGGTVTSAGSGYLQVAPAATLSTAGTLTANVRFYAGGGTPILPARTYGGTWVQVYGPTTTVVQMAAGIINISGYLDLQAIGTGNLTLDGATNNPTVNITGKVDFTGTGAGTEIITAGSGTWTVGGNIDFTAGTFTKGTSTLVMTGSGAVLTSAGNALNNLTCENNTTFSDALLVDGIFKCIVPSKTLTFGTAVSHVLADIQLDGQAAGTKIVLVPSTPATVFNWNVAAAVQTDVSYVSVSYCNAGAGSQIDASNGTNFDGGNNVNWVFEAENSLHVVSHDALTPSIVFSPTPDNAALASPQSCDFDLLYDNDESVTVTAPESDPSGWIWDGWYVGGVQQESSKTYTFILSAETTVVATYTLNIALYPTIESIGFRYSLTDPLVVSAVVQYRQTGSEDWTTGFTPVITEANADFDTGTRDVTIITDPFGANPSIRRVHGSIFWLTGGTSYDVRLILKNAGGDTLDTLTRTTSTWDVTYPFGQSTGNIITAGVGGDYATIALALAAASPGDIVSVLAGTYTENITMPTGSSDNPITLRGTEGAIVAGRIILNDYNVIRDMIFTVETLGSASFVNLSSKTEILIEDCVFTVTVGSEVGEPYHIFGDGVSKTVIRRCVFNGEDKYWGEGCAWEVKNFRGLVVADNDIRIGVTTDDGSRFWNGEDSDFQDNIVEIGGVGDDVMEVENATHVNVRFWENRFWGKAGSRALISHAPVIVGPVYHIRNEYYTSNQFVKVDSGTIKGLTDASNQLAPLGQVFFLHNDIHAYGSRYSNGVLIYRFPNWLCHSRITWWNNIIYGKYLDVDTVEECYDYGAIPVRPTPTGAGTYKFGEITADYNLYQYTDLTTNPNSGLDPGVDDHSVFDEADYADPEKADADWESIDLRLLPTSPAINTGLVLPGINDDYQGDAPDIGAHESTLPKAFYHNYLTRMWSE